MDAKKHILVIDIPLDATAEAAELLLNEPYMRGYYLQAIFPGQTEARAFFRLRVRPEKNRSE